MMKSKKINYDTVLDSFIRSLINTEINEQDFSMYVEMFSKYLGYTNSNYKYNITYLNQYINEFIKSSGNLKYKDSIYNVILWSLIKKISGTFDLLIDNSYYVHFDGIENLDKNKPNYIRYDADKINCNKFEIKFEMEHQKEDFIFCKKYDDENINFLASDIILFLQEKGVLEKDK